MANEARFILTAPAMPLANAQALAERLEYAAALEPLAIAVNEADEAAELWQTAAYFETEAAARDAAQLLKLENSTIEAVPSRDWVRESLAGLAPIAAGRFFLHGSHDRPRRRCGGTSLEIDAGTAFGTGHHGTTEGCLLALDRLLKRTRPLRILDVGCGTGILAIAAARATKRPALASDIDPEAVRVTRANAKRNGVAPLIGAVKAAGLGHRRIARRAPYDLIFANILARPLVQLAGVLARALAPGGHLILSGLTRDQCQWLTASYRNRGPTVSNRIARGNWVSLAMMRPMNGMRPAGESCRAHSCRSAKARQGKNQRGSSGPTPSW